MLKTGFEALPYRKQHSTWKDCETSFTPKQGQETAGTHLYFSKLGLLFVAETGNWHHGKPGALLAGGWPGKTCYGTQACIQ